ncbi:MAG: hypothetical protein CV088_00750 [Nitrospira sp. LK70]|nr:hypothetical protein [Nitrospira sp. LK70]
MNVELEMAKLQQWFPQKEGAMRTQRYRVWKVLQGITDFLVSTFRTTSSLSKPAAEPAAGNSRKKTGPIVSSTGVTERTVLRDHRTKRRPSFSINQTTESGRRSWQDVMGSGHGR